MEPYLARRLQFLLDEARDPYRRTDEAVRKTLRCVSNYATVERDGQTTHVKKANRWVSGAAYDAALEVRDFNVWHKLTTNEHEHELDVIWKALVKQPASFGVDDTLAYFQARPFVTVTLQENAKLRELRLKGRSDRYSTANIRVGQAVGLWIGNKLSTPTPAWVPRENVSSG